MENKTLKIVVAALAILLAIAVGYIAGHSFSKPAAEAPAPQEPEVAAVEEVAAPAAPVAVEKPAAPAQVQEEKTYGYYPSFYVKKLYYTVDADDDNHSIRIYMDSNTSIKKAYTNCKWLEEDNIERGGKTFHVKRNKDSESRKGQLILVDNRDRKITIYVTQTGEE